LSQGPLNQNLDCGSTGKLEVFPVMGRGRECLTAG